MLIYRIYILIITLSILSTSSTAQIGVGFRAGFLRSSRVSKFTTLTTTSTPNGPSQSFEIKDDPITGFIIGIPLEFELSRVMSMQLELNYLKQGFSNQIEVLQSISKFQVSYAVLEIPILAKVGSGNEKFDFSAVVGPSFQYTSAGIIESSSFEAGRVTIPASSDKIDFSDQNQKTFNRSSIYGLLGAQLGLYVGTGKVVVDARYRFALTDQNSSTDANVRGRGTSATLGYMVTFGNY